jgi:hypothetical protein
MGADYTFLDFNYGLSMLWKHRKELEGVTASRSLSAYINRCQTKATPTYLIKGMLELESRPEVG